MNKTKAFIRVIAGTLALTLVVFVSFGLLTNGSSDNGRSSMSCRTHIFGSSSNCIDRECLICHTIVEATAPHQFVVEEEVPASCEHSGYVSYKCAACQYTAEQYSAPKEEHVFVNGICSHCGELAEETRIQTFSADVVDMNGYPFYIANETKLDKGKSMVLEFSIESLDNYDNIKSNNRALKLCGHTTIGKLWRHELNEKGKSWSVLNDIKINGSAIANGYNLMLPYKKGEAYKMEMIPSDKSGNKYNWKFYKNNVLQDSSENIDYEPFYGIYMYGFNFHMKINNLRVYSRDRNLKPFGYGNGTSEYCCTIRNESAKNKVASVSTKKTFKISGTNAIVKDSSMKYNNSGNSFEILPSESDLKIHLVTDEFSNMKLGELIHMNFKIYPVKTKASQKYRELEMQNFSGNIIDYGFPVEQWSNISFDTRLTTKNRVKGVEITIHDKQENSFIISDITFDKNVIPLDNILGGAKLIQLPSSLSTSQMESYVMVTPEKKVLVIDGGYPDDAEKLHKQLVRLGGVVDGWFISHYHSDHVGALVSILNQYRDITIKNLCYDFNVSDEILEKYGDNSNHYVNDIEQAIAATRVRIDNIITPHRGDKFTFGSVTVKTLNDAYFGPGNNMGNDSSIVYKVETPGEDVLFLADICLRANEYLNDDYFASEIKNCRIVQLAHHGQSGVPDSFYDYIDEIVVALYCAPGWLFDCQTDDGFATGPWATMHTRQEMREHGVRYNFSFKYGQVELK